LRGIAAKKGLDDKRHTKADTELHADNCQTLPSAGYKRDLRVAVEAAELGRHRKFLLGYNSQIGHTTAKPGVVCRTLDRRQDCTADEQQCYGIWSEQHRLVAGMAFALSAEEIAKGRRVIASLKGRGPAVGVDTLPAALCRRTRDEWVYCVGWQARPVRVVNQDCSFQHRGSVLELHPVAGRCQNKAHRRSYRSSEPVGGGDPHTPAGKHTAHTGPATAARGGLGEGRMVGCSDSSTWSPCRFAWTRRYWNRRVERGLH
jgi:hypothetical protein